MKDMIRIGYRWFNPADVTLVELVTKTAPDAPPAVKVHTTANDGNAIWEFSGDEAEAVLKEVGYGKDAREKEAKDKAVHAAKEAHDAKVAADKVAADEAKAAAKEEKAHAKEAAAEAKDAAKGVHEAKAAK